MRVGDLYWVELRASGGRAQAGRRPAIILQQTSNLPTVLVVPITSQQDALRFPGTVLIESTKENGLRHDSVALVFQLTAIDIRHVTNHLGVASQEVMENIWQALDDLTGRG